MDEKFIILGIALIIAGFFILFVGTLIGMENQKETPRESFKGGGVIMIGPIPIGFGTDKETMIIVMILAILLMIIAFLFFSWIK